MFNGENFPSYGNFDHMKLCMFTKKEMLIAITHYIDSENKYFHWVCYIADDHLYHLT